MESLIQPLFFLASVFAVAVTLDCPPLTPPEQGVLKCQWQDEQLQCVSSCYGNHVFDTSQEVVVKTCDHVTGQWQGGDSLPVCLDGCQNRLLNDYFSHSTTGPLPRLSASSDVDTRSDVSSLQERAVLGSNAYTVWRPETEDLNQFVQVEFPVKTRFNGLVIRGDGITDFVTSFRLLFSEDGVTWFPYTDGDVEDKFFIGARNSISEATHMFSCPHEARFVRVNPLTWEGHPAFSFDLLGCAVDHKEHMCKPLTPPKFGVVDCEVDGQNMFCTAYCQGKKVFKNEAMVLTRTCMEPEGRYEKYTFPECVDRDVTLEPTVHITGYCMQMEMDCYNMHNGDYQFCSDCHYFSTCSHGYLYVRSCPVGLRFDAVNGLCDYNSRTCSSQHGLARQPIREGLGDQDGH